MPVRLRHFQRSQCGHQSVTVTVHLSELPPPLLYKEPKSEKTIQGDDPPAMAIGCRVPFRSNFRKYLSFIHIYFCSYRAHAYARVLCVIRLVMLALVLGRHKLRAPNRSRSVSPSHIRPPVPP